MLQEARWKDITHGVQNHLTECSSGVKVASLARATAVGRYCFGLVEITGSEEHMVALACPTQPERAPHTSRTDDANLHGLAFWRPHVERSMIVCRKCLAVRPMLSPKGWCSIR